MTAPELKAVNIPTFHLTPLNIMLSPTSVAAAPVLSSPCLSSSSTRAAQKPSSSVLNFTLQHVGLIPAGVQVPANPFLQHVPVSSQPEHGSCSSENMNVQEEKVSKTDGDGLSGKRRNSFSAGRIFKALPQELAAKASVSTAASRGEEGGTSILPAVEVEPAGRGQDVKRQEGGCCTDLLTLTDKLSICYFLTPCYSPH